MLEVTAPAAGEQKYDVEYEQKTVDALTEMRTSLGFKLATHNIIPSRLEPPTWHVEKQLGICSRSGAEFTRKSNDSVHAKNKLLPCYFRLFPAQFMNSEAPFTKDVNSTLCRFLRARDYDVAAALEMYKGALKIRSELQAEDVLKERDPNERCWQFGTPYYHYGHDKLGRPFYIELSGRVRVGKLMEPVGFLTFEDFTRRHVIHMECMSRRIEHASLRYGKHVSQLSQIMDLEGLSYFGDSRAMKLFQDTIKMDQNVYPEYLGNLFLINAPLIFRGMWILIKGWMEKKTSAKFYVLGSDYLPTLLQYIDVDELPKEYGGNNSFALPTVQFEGVPTERLSQYEGVDGLSEDGGYTCTDANEDVAAEKDSDDDSDEDNDLEAIAAF